MLVSVERLIHLCLKVVSVRFNRSNQERANLTFCKFFNFTILNNGSIDSDSKRRFPHWKKLLDFLEVPERLIGDKAYDSDRLDERLMETYGTELIAPNRANRAPTQDGRPLRRYVRRWKIERLFAWLFNFRRLVVRYEYHAQNFQGFLHRVASARVREPRCRDG